MRVEGGPCLVASLQHPSSCKELEPEGSTHTEGGSELRPGPHLWPVHSHWRADLLGSSFLSSSQHCHFRTLGAVLSEVPHLQPRPLA